MGSSSLLFEKFGHRSMELIEAEEMWLGNRYVLVRSWWRFAFERLGRAAESLENESSFLVDANVEPLSMLVDVTPSGCTGSSAGENATASGR